MQCILNCKQVLSTCLFPHDWARYLQHMFLLRSAIFPIFGPRCTKLDVVRQIAVSVVPVVCIQDAIDFVTMSIVARAKELRHINANPHLGYYYGDGWLICADWVDVWINFTILDVPLFRVVVASRHKLFAGEKSSKDSVCSLITYLFAWPFVDASFAFVLVAIVLWTRQSSPTSNLESFFIRWWRKNCFFDGISARCYLR